MKHESARAKTVEWMTPPEIIRSLGDFDLDPCSPLNRPWDTAAHHFTQHDNGLLQEWFGRVWLNPPYGQQTGRWMARLADHGTGTAFIFARTETEFFFKSVWESATALLFLKGRVHFHLPNGKRAKKNGGAPSVLIAYGHNDADRLSCSGIDGQFVPLRLPTIIAVALGGNTRSWRQVVKQAVENRGGTVRLSDLYQLLRNHPKTRANRHWQAKIRQTLQKGPFQALGNGQWMLEV